MALRAAVSVASCAAAGASWIGCAATLQPHGFDSGMQAAADVKGNANQVRLKMRSLVDPMCGEIERAADQIAAGTTDPVVRRAAMLWKIEAVPALREALFQPNAFVALSDAWVLFYQMAAFFETGPGKAALADSAPAAVETCRHLEQEMAEVAASATVSGDVSALRGFVEKWAAEHPIQGAVRERESTLGRALERDFPESFSASEAALWVAVSLDDLNRRLEVYSSQLIQQARWEVDLLGSDLKIADTLSLAQRAVQSAEKASATLDRVAPQLERTVNVVEGAPTILAAERRTALDALAVQLTRTMAFIEEERVAGFKQVGQERTAFLTDVHKALHEERLEFDREIDHIGQELVDRVFWRLAQLMAAAVLSVMVIVMGALLVARKLFSSPSK